MSKSASERDRNAPLERRRGLVLVLSSPSGAGKTTITRRLLDMDPDLRISVSATTRPKRPGEVEGVHYFFVDKPQFERMIAAGELLEYAEVFGNLYGTPKAPGDAMLGQGLDVVADVDWQGTQQLRQSFRDDMVSIFVLPPSIDELERRLRSRAQDGEEVVQSRMALADSEISHWPEYDYVIVNDDLDETLETVSAILKVERLKRPRRLGLTDFVRDLRRGS